MKSCFSLKFLKLNSFLSVKTMPHKLRIIKKQILITFLRLRVEQCDLKVPMRIHMALRDSTKWLNDENLSGANSHGPKCRVFRRKGVAKFFFMRNFANYAYLAIFWNMEVRKFTHFAVRLQFRMSRNFVFREIKRSISWNPFRPCKRSRKNSTAGNLFFCKLFE